MAYSLRQKTKIWKAVNRQYATGNYTIASCCNAQAISVTTFKKWDKLLATSSTETDPGSVEGSEESVTKASKSVDSYEAARDSRREKHKGKLLELAETALEYHLKLQTFDEKKQSGKLDSTTGKVKVDKVEVTKKRKDPNPMLIRFTLENTDPENYKTKQVIEHEGENPFIALMKAASNNQKPQ